MSDIWLFFDIGDTLVNEDRLRFRFSNPCKKPSVWRWARISLPGTAGIAGNPASGRRVRCSLRHREGIAFARRAPRLVEGVATFVRNAGQSELRPIPWLRDILRSCPALARDHRRPAGSSSQSVTRLGVRGILFRCRSRLVDWFSQTGPTPV